MVMITEQNNTFHLTNGRISYLFQVEEFGQLAQIYYGKAIKHYSGHFRYPRLDRSFSPNPAETTDRFFSLDTLLQEYPTNGSGDFREPALALEFADGSQVTQLVFDRYEIVTTKPELMGLPQSFAQKDEAKTLVVYLKDPVKEIDIALMYTVFQHMDVIARSVKITNRSQAVVKLQQAASLALDFATSPGQLQHLSGAWARERMIIRETITSGVKKIASTRGASSHFHHPSFTLLTPQTTEFQGEAFGFCLLYSGNHQSMIEKDAYDQVRVTMGINPDKFLWTLQPEETFTTPEAIMAYSAQGLNELSQQFHRFFEEHVIRSPFKKTPRPVLINNWEATYFDFNQERLETLIDEASLLGVELFVLDDGWFGKREDDQTSLGDWQVNTTKLTKGLAGVSDYAHAHEMQFGLWFEPEMISEKSELFAHHPNWAIQTPQRKRSLSRSQYVLDLANPEVQDYLFDAIAAILDQTQIDYIKWDMNRNITEAYSTSLAYDRQGEFFHRYILGVYALLERLCVAYPEVMIEGCSGGGGRFDAGMLYYTPQIWTSDDTDAYERLKIQYGTSQLFPPSTMGAHISAVPNHQTGRYTSLAFRRDVAMCGIFGLELDLTALAQSEKAELAEAIAFYKEHRQLLQYGAFYRLVSPFEQKDAAFMVVNQEKTEAIAYYYRGLIEPSEPLHVLKFTALDPTKRYQVNNEQILYGDELMQMGLYVPLPQIGDFQSILFHIKAI